MKRLDLGVIIDEKDFTTAKRKDPGAYQQRVEVLAKGKTFKEIAVHPKGGGYVKCDGKTCGVYMEELRNTDEEIIQKFTDNVTKVFSYDEAFKAAQGILELEKLENITQLMELVVPIG